jgi:PIN domain nuclease of toxin-antitoxin system
LEEIIATQQRVNHIIILPVVLTHVLTLQDLPPHHKDPFDRLLIAQTLIEEATLISHDPVFTRYAIQVIK